jgi:DNA replicative helicase MCM subunit Mcm2 (Cdc46/Mcm family)
MVANEVSTTAIFICAHTVYKEKHSKKAIVITLVGGVTQNLSFINCNKYFEYQ